MSKNYNNERIDESVCLYKFTGVFHSYTYFNLVNENDINSKTLIVIRSAWLISYQDKLADSLSKNTNVELLSKDDIKLVEQNNCDWLNKANFEEFAVKKGSVFSNIYNNNTEQVKKAVSLATKALDNNYPAVEISMLVLIPIISVLLILFSAIWLDERKIKKANNYQLSQA